MTSALVLSGGLGTRLGEATQNCPKPLLDVAGRPLLAHILQNLARAGVTRALVNVHFLPEHFDAFLEYWGPRLPAVTLHPEAALRGTAGTLRDVRAFLEEDPGPFVVHYGDILTDMLLTPLLDDARCGAHLGAVLLHRRSRPQSVATLEDGEVVAFEERPAWALASEVPQWTFSGIAALNPGIFPVLDELNATDLPRDAFPELARRRLLRATPLAGARFAIDSLERLVQARAAWSNHVALENIHE